MELLAHGSYVDVTVSTANTWETKTLDSSFDGASGVIILWNINNQGRSGTRPKGASTSLPPRKREDGQRVEFVRLDTNNQFEIRASNTANSAWVIGHFTGDEATLFDADIYSKEITPTKDGTWKTVDLSSHTASAGPTAAIIMIESSDAANGNSVGWRDAGSSDTRTAPMMSGDSLMVLCPSTGDDIELTIGSSDTVTSIYLIGYVTDGLTKETSASYDPTTGSWQDIDTTTDIPGGETYTGVVVSYWLSAFGSAAFRQNGDTTDYNDGREQTQVPLLFDAGDVIEAKISSASTSVKVDFWAFSAGGGSAVNISDVETTENIQPGQTAVTITGTNFEATQGSGTVKINGVTQTVTSWSDTSIDITVVQGNNKFGGHNLEVTNNSASSDTIAITLSPATAHGYVDMSSPITDDPASVAYNTTPAVVTGDQFEWHDDQSLGNLTVGADGLVTNVDNTGSFQGRFWDATDGTWGSWQTFQAQVNDGVAPTVVSGTVPTNGTYNSAQNLDFNITFSENVDVDGTPFLSLSIGASTVAANYVSGSGTSVLLFRYTVQAGDEDLNGIAVTSLDHGSGGGITDVFGLTADLTLNGIPSTAGILVDAKGPSMTSMAVPAAGTYAASANLDFTVNWTENTDVTGTPRIALDIGGVTRYATYVSGTGTAAHLFRYTAQAGDNDGTGITVTALELNGGTLLDSEGNAASLALSGVEDTTGVLVDTTAPVVTIDDLTTDDTTPILTGTIDDNTASISVNIQSNDYVGVISTNTWSAQVTNALNIGGPYVATVTATDPAGNSSQDTANVTIQDTQAPVINSVTTPAPGVYDVAETMTITVNYSEIVTVTGGPFITVNIGGTNRNFAYSTGSGTQSISFTYDPVSGDNGVAPAIGNITLNGGTIQDAQANNAPLDLGAPSTAGVTVDTVAAVISVNELTTINTTPIVTGTCTEDTATLTLVVNNVTYNPIAAGGVWSQQLQTLDIGQYTMVLNAVDVAGHNSTEAQAVLIIQEDVQLPDPDTVDLLSEAINLLKHRLGRYTANPTELDTFILDELRAAQRRLEDGPELPWFLKKRVYNLQTAPTVQAINLPNDYLRVREDYEIPVQLKINGVWTHIRIYPYKKVWRQLKGTGQPKAASLDGNNLALFPTPDTIYTTSLAYYAKQPELEKGLVITNKWMEHAFDLIMAEAGLVLATTYLKNAEAKSWFEMKLIDARRRLNDANIAQEIAAMESWGLDNDH